MFENFKTDIIYYNTPADFELEFNLCGCCRMRLFNDKCSDKKALLLSLSRAVSRSKVTIITAPLFTEENIMQTVASAIGSKTEVINNADYKIASDSEISVIKNSLPLVTTDGVFGGCIIESGPQSLIILTENKGVRKSLMKTLIHQYIAEISLRVEPSVEPVTDKPNEEITETLEEAEIEATNEETVILDENEEDLSAEPSKETEENITTIPDQESPTPYTDISSGDKDDMDNDDDDDNFDYNYNDEKPDANPSAFNIWMLVISIVLLVAIAVLCYCIFYVPTKAGISPSAYLKEIFGIMFK